ncbi:hypothetical protein BGV68_13635 [Burkholderia ubonensis]|nr:hypothetical protein WI74_31845 [Burkholderia ubonensis]OJA55237.1 hypothetical protein BGV68_13635 [Burkholderia ubonensis]
MHCMMQPHRFVSERIAQHYRAFAVGSMQPSGMSAENDWFHIFHVLFLVDACEYVRIGYEVIGGIRSVIERDRRTHVE